MFYNRHDQTASLQVIFAALRPKLFFKNLYLDQICVSSFKSPARQMLGMWASSTTAQQQLPVISMVYKYCDILSMNIPCKNSNEARAKI